ncbi:MAG: hypothetical protein ABS79_05505 [Planctomycetes bacterium SCN 63-9]|nr:MAG: hypothetical protein ABS79_05505 [Planctomycetes bacterium SCN 63-9]
MLAIMAALGVATSLPARGDGEPAPDSVPGATLQRLLINLVPRPGGGLLVRQISPNSPTLQLRPAANPAVVERIEVGDVVTRVNGEAVNTLEALNQALTRQSGQARLTIIDKGTGRAADYTCKTSAVQQRLLIDLEFLPGTGAKALSLKPGSPTARMRSAANPAFVATIVPGDVITRINGENVDTPEAYIRALNRRAGGVRLTIADGATGQVSDWLSDTTSIASAAPEIAPAPAAARRSAWILLVGLTDDISLGLSVEESLNKLQQLFKAEVEEDRMQLRILKGDACNANTILQTVRGLASKPDDTVLVYYLGHGAYDPNAPEDDPTRGHFFQIPSGDLSRASLRQTINARPGRLKILISDTCNVPGQPRFRLSPVAEARVAQIRGLTPTEKLLFHFRGTLDIGASSRGESSWFSLPYGGWFTWNLLQLLPDQSDWGSLLPKLATASNGFYVSKRMDLLANPGDSAADAIESIRNQTSMTPMLFANELNSDIAQADANNNALRNITRTTRLFLP